MSCSAARDAESNIADAVFRLSAARPRPGNPSVHAARRARGRKAARRIRVFARQMARCRRRARVHGRRSFAPAAGLAPHPCRGHGRDSRSLGNAGCGGVRRGALSEAETPPRSDRLAYCALALFAVVLWFATLSLRPLFNPDEGRYAEIPREMLASGDWAIPHLNGLLYIEKPPLQYWATAVSLSIFGQNELGARFYTALCALGTVLAAASRRGACGGRGRRSGRCAPVEHAALFDHGTAAHAGHELDGLHDGRAHGVSRCASARPRTSSGSSCS